MYWARLTMKSALRNCFFLELNFLQPKINDSTSDPNIHSYEQKSEIILLNDEFTLEVQDCSSHYENIEYENFFFPTVHLHEDRIDDVSTCSNCLANWLQKKKILSTEKLQFIRAQKNNSFSHPPVSHNEPMQLHVDGKIDQQYKKTTLTQNINSSSKVIICEGEGSLRDNTTNQNMVFVNIDSMNEVKEVDLPKRRIKGQPSFECKILVNEYPYEEIKGIQTAAAVVCEEVNHNDLMTQQNLEINHLKRKKKHTFPVKRTKTKPLPVLDETYPSSKSRPSNLHMTGKTEKDMPASSIKNCVTCSIPNHYTTSTSITSTVQMPSTSILEKNSLVIETILPSKNCLQSLEQQKPITSSHNISVRVGLCSPQQISTKGNVVNPDPKFEVLSCDTKDKNLTDSQHLCCKEVTCKNITSTLTGESKNERKKYAESNLFANSSGSCKTNSTDQFEDDCSNSDQIATSSVTNECLESIQIIRLFESVSLSIRFYGCLEQSFNMLLEKFNKLSTLKSEFFKLLSERSTMNLLRALKAILDKIGREGVQVEEFGNISISLQALNNILAVASQKNFGMIRSDIGRLAEATLNLSNSDILAYIKKFLKYKGYLLDCAELTCLYQNVVNQQLKLTLETSKTTKPKCPSTKLSNYSLCSESLANISRLLFPKKPASGDICKSIDIKKLKNPNVFSDYEKMVPTHNYTTFIASKPESFCHRDRETKTGVDSRMSLKREELEKLVNNFKYLEYESQQAIEAYTVALLETQHAYASSLLQRINSQK